MDDAGDLPLKADVARALLVNGTVFVHLDPRAPGVVVPPWYRDQAQLVLQVGLDMAVPIPDLRVSDEGLWATLSFNRTPYACEVPWEAVFAMTGEDARGMVWPDDVPAEILVEVEREAGRAAPAPLETEDDDDDDDGAPSDHNVVSLYPGVSSALAEAAGRAASPWLGSVLRPRSCTATCFTQPSAPK